MRFRLYIYLRYGKGVKSTSSLIRHINTCIILITLSSRQTSKLRVILEDNTTNCLDLPLDKKDINPRVSNHSKKEIKPASNDNDDIRPTNID